MGKLSFARRRASNRAAAWVLAGCLEACAAPPSPTAPALTPGAAQDVPLVVQPVQERTATWVLLPERSEPSVVLPYDHGRTAFITDGLRVLEDPGGSLQHGVERLPGSNTNAIALSAHLGSGFLFQSDLEAETVLWRAESWTGRLRPLARLPERASQVTVGFGRIFARLTDSGETVALDLANGALIDRGPLPDSPSYFDLMFWDRWFAVAHTDIRGILATFDAGASWHATGLSEESATFELHPDGIIVASGAVKHLLRPDGSWRELEASDADPFAELVTDKLGLELPPTSISPGRPHPLGRRPLETAVLHGWPLDEQRAVLAYRGSVGIVNLVSGIVEDSRRHVYPGAEACTGVRLGEGVGFVCPLSDGTTGIYQLGANLTLLPVAQLAAGQAVRSSGNGQLVAQGPCPSSTTARSTQLPRETETILRSEQDAQAKPQDSVRKRPYCVMSGIVNALPKVKQVSVTGDVGAERVLGLEDGRTVILVPPRLGSPGNLTLVDSASTDTVALRFARNVSQQKRVLVESGLWLKDPTQIDADTLGTWVAGTNRLVGVTLTLNGVIQVSSRGEADLRRTHLSGRRAFEASSGESAWQTLDYGQTWTQIDAPRGLTRAANRRYRPAGCSEVGCSLGDWLRVGYRVDEPKASGSDAADDSTRDPGRPLPSQPTLAAGATASTPSNAALASTSVLPHDADVPKTLNLRASGYSQWDLTCYPTGAHEGARGTSAENVLMSSQQPPRHAVATGFLAMPVAAAATGADVANSANRPFLGVPRPRAKASDFAFDMGADATHQFRAYTWGQDGEAWPRSGTWVVRVADRFAVDGLWSNAPTRVPWPNILTAAQLFGADRANRYASSWQLSLDPSERAGVLRITTTGTTELHFIEQDKATLSVGNTVIGPISGVAKLRGVWHFGSQDGARFHVYRLLQGKLSSVGDYPVSDAVHASLVRDVEATRLAILLRAPAGTWHLYPLSAQGVATEPIALDRDKLNQEWPHCDPEERGWLVVGALPFSRFASSGGGQVLSFDGGASAWRAEAVTARAVVSRSNTCIQALAARLASSASPQQLTRTLPSIANTIPLTLTDRLNDVRYGFQCAP